MTDTAGSMVGRAQIEGYWGIGKRLNSVLPIITAKPSIETAKPQVWTALETLKKMRDHLVMFTTSTRTPDLEMTHEKDCSLGLSPLTWLICSRS